MGEPTALPCWKGGGGGGLQLNVCMVNLMMHQTGKTVGTQLMKKKMLNLKTMIGKRDLNRSGELGVWVDKFSLELKNGLILGSAIQKNQMISTHSRCIDEHGMMDPRCVSKLSYSVISESVQSVETVLSKLSGACRFEC